MGYTGLFLKNFFSNFRSHIKDSKWGRKCIFINCSSCNVSPQQIPFQFANGKLPHSCCREFWALSSIIYSYHIIKANFFAMIWFCSILSVVLNVPVMPVENHFHMSNLDSCWQRLMIWWLLLAQHGKITWSNAISVKKFEERKGGENNMDTPTKKYSPVYWF